MLNLEELLVEKLSIADINDNPSSISERQILILYGSQTGCAQDVAERISRQAKRRRFKTRIYSMDAYDRDNLINENLVIFVCSTTGQGDEPDNMRKFWKYLLRKNLPNDILNQMKFSVFGLGDSSYLRYNWPAKKLYKRLLQLGAQSILPRGDGDDQHYLGIDGGLDPWLEELWKVLMYMYPLPSSLDILPEDFLTKSFTPAPSFRIEFIDRKLDLDDENLSRHDMYSYLTKNERVTSHEHFQDVRHMEFNINDSDFKYDPGDVLVVRPKNLSEEVDEFIKMMDWEEIADNAFVLVPNDDEDRKVPSHWDSILTLRKLFENYLDIFSTPRRSFFEFLSFFTTDENHTEKLREFCSAEGQDDLYAYNQRVRRTIVEVFQDFPSAKIQLEYIPDMFPELQPRQFSISSSSKVHPGQIHLTVAIVQYKTRLQKPRRGVCTNWMSSLKPGECEIPVIITKGTMRLPTSISIPVIFIGPGTGVSVMRAFLEDRIYEGATGIYISKIWNRDKDFYYQEQWDRYVNEGKLKLFVAFSRDQDNKRYVQHVLKGNAKLVYDILYNREGRADKMPNDVIEAFKSILISEGEMTNEQAEKYMLMIEKTKRYQQEVW
ncbi:4830_t:CDS:10 [Funneliformis geosporum]|uniref:NADPH-dependent diflavin oxidoreductase 1 n=1 Tax=Funneliformis geosporum TaxID=1117311 RepID=A0A9W4WZV4_9GLOM|nr:4830_t:CDS:10 [Funneliformis geosporum]CAI2184789.1 4908_t:CDS:10 [Funneliformis geosporum]